MQTELEATFPNITKAIARKKLKVAGARLIKPEFLQKRVVFNLPRGHEIKGGWLRIRNEGDKTTMSLKIVDGPKIENQKEVELIVSDLKSAEEFLTIIGCRKKAFQESKRELWRLNDVHITIDEWPFLESFIELEGLSEKSVKAAAKKLGLDFGEALFCAVGTLYSAKYKIPTEIINNRTPLLTFKGKNPFVKKPNPRRPR